MSQTLEQKATQIISALALPEGHYAVLHEGESLVKEIPYGVDNVEGWMDIYVTTAVWFQLYESTESGILWTLCLPDPNSIDSRCEHPHLEYELLDIAVRVFYAPDNSRTVLVSQAIADAEKVDGIPVLKVPE